jgi:hypothetical protein
MWDAFQFWLTLDKNGKHFTWKSACVSARMLKITSWMFIGAKNIRIWNKRCREMFYAQCNLFARNFMLCCLIFRENVADFNQGLLSGCRLDKWGNLVWFCIGNGVWPFRNLRTCCRANTAAYWIDSGESSPGSKATAAGYYWLPRDRV